MNEGTPCWLLKAYTSNQNAEAKVGVAHVAEQSYTSEQV